MRELSKNRHKIAVQISLFNKKIQWKPNVPFLEFFRESQF